MLYGKNIINTPQRGHRRNISKNLLSNKGGSAREFKQKKQKKNSVLVDTIYVILVKDEKSLELASSRNPCNQYDVLKKMVKSEKMTFPFVFFILMNGGFPVYYQWWTGINTHYIFDNRIETDFKILKQINIYKNKNKKVPIKLLEKSDKIAFAYYDTLLLPKFINKKTFVSRSELYIDNKTQLYSLHAC